VFTPSLYVGAVTGGAFGVVLTNLFPGLHLSPEAYALVGMGALVAGATAAPITGILIVFEMTNDYAIVLPLMLTSVIAYVIARRLEPDSLYSGWLRRRGEHIEHGAMQDVLADLRVGDALEPNPQVVSEGATLAQLLAHLEEAVQTDLPVVGRHGEVRGIINIVELGRTARDSAHMTDLVIAADLLQPIQPLRPDDSLREAIRRMGIRGSGALPVADPEGGRLIGMVTRAHILAVYERALARAGSR
jgi:CIC family chloride channel protein